MEPVTREAFAGLIAASAVRPRLKRELRFVPEEMNDWESRDFIAVTTKSGGEGVIIAPLNPLYVVTFQLQNRKPNANGRTEAIICDFCAIWQRGSSSAVITFSKTRGNVTFLCCGDLLCSLHVRDKTSIAKLSRTQLRETMSKERRIDRLRTKLAQILHDVAAPVAQ